MGQARHGPAQGAARLVVVEGRFMGGHGVHDPVVLEVGDWLQKQLVLAANQPQNGDTQNGSIYIEGFGWIPDEGGGTIQEEIHSDGDINKQVGIMG